MYKILDTCLDVLFRVNLAKPKRSNKSKSVVSEVPVVSEDGLGSDSKVVILPFLGMEEISIYF